MTSSSQSLLDLAASVVAPVCIECANTASLVTGKRVYPHRTDLYSRHFWLCECGAYCGTHRGTVEPLGCPCGPETRKARSRAHAAFDPLWRGSNAPMRRGEAYAWLARRLGISREDCHIGMMDAVDGRRHRPVLGTLHPRSEAARACPRSGAKRMNLYRPLTPELDDLDLIASRFDGYDEQPRYTREEWRDAAQYLIDSEDDSELRFMARQQALFDGFCRLPEREQDAWVDFGNYAARMGGAQ